MSEQPSNLLAQRFQAAAAMHQAGQLAEAEREYRAILTADQNYAPAWHLLGVIAMQSNHLPQAIEHIQTAITLGLGGADVYNNLGEALRASNQFDQAIAAYQEAIKKNPNYAAAYANLGTAYNETGKFALALPEFQKALSLRRDHANTLFQYGVTLRKLGQRDAAIDAWERVLRIAPDHVSAMSELGEVLHRRERYDAAIKVLRRLTEKYPKHADGHANLGRSLAATGAFDEAIAEARKAIDLQPDNATHHTALGVVLAHAGRLDESITTHRKAIELDPKLHIAHANLGGTLTSHNRPDEAIESFNRALALRPDHWEIEGSLAGVYFLARQPQMVLETVDRAIAKHPMIPVLHRHRSIALFALGRYPEGFEESEWRWRVDAPQHNPRREFDRPMWDGSDPTGRKILVHPEQGYGDVIQFARYVPMLAAAGAKVLLEVPAPVRDLMSSLRCEAQIIPKGVKLPDFDLHIPLMSLPRIYKTTLESIPSGIPYLFANESRLEKLRSIVQASNLKVAIVWAGNMIPDPRRTVPSPDLFEALADVPNVTWFSLQFGDQRAQLKDAPASMKVIDLADHIKDFADSAAAMSLVDLVITIDTATAHLAGALGVKTWTLLTAAPDWRWGWEGDSTPWYPGMRLFRQKTLGDWSPVLEVIKSELMNLSS